MKKLSQIALRSSVVLLALLGGCATRTPPPLDVGAVVVAPKAQLPAVPTVVQKTEPKPEGYFQCRLLTYLRKSCERPTTSTSPTPAAVQTPTQ